MSRFLITAGSDFEAGIIRARMAEAGITVLVGAQQNRGTIGTPARDIYVEDDQLERAREVLQAAGAVDEDDLEALSRQSAPPMAPARPIPGAALWKAILKRGRKAEGASPEDGSD